MASLEGMMQKRLLVCAALVSCMALSQNAWAKTDLGFRSIGGDVGVVDPENLSGTLGVGVFADCGTLSPDIRLAPQIGYWSKSEQFGGDKSTISDVSFGARGLYMFHGTSPKFRPYAGAGLGLHMVHAKVETAAQDMGGGVIIPAMEASDTSSKLGLDMGGGFTTPLSEKTNFCLDLWYTAVSDVGHLSMKAGVSFDLGGSPHAAAAPAPAPTHRSRARH
jgi:outer membrane protein with beta-barrel domain